ncbi:MAG: zinc-binding dehydrogenase [Acidobacteriia bacterium]|nr:zinc-binding dehydrogenase [Terriglobia bacterium]
MKAWRLERPGGTLAFSDVPMPKARPGSVLVKIQATPLLSYFKPYVEGKLPYSPPSETFTPGTNGVGIIEAVGRDVWHLKTGQRVVFSPHFVSGENVDDPAQILIGLTGFGAASPAVQTDWPDGSLAEYALAPVSTITPAEGLDGFDAAQVALLNRFIVPFGGLLRGRLAAGETLIVNGATGAYGTAAVLLGVAMAAGQVIAAGRDEGRLDAVVRVGGRRVKPVRMTGDVSTDTAALRSATGGGAHIAFDMVGQAADSTATLASLQSLRRGGRLVLMGSMTVPLSLSYSDIMRNNWEITGQFMYPPDAYRRLIEMLRAGLLDISEIRPLCFPLKELMDAAEAAAKATNLECVVVQP